MKLNRNENFIIMIMALYFGWLLSFPLYGPVISSAQNAIHQNLPLVVIFFLFYCFSSLIGGFVLKNQNNWHKILFVSTLTSLFVNILLLLFAHKFVWTIGFGILGVSSAFYALGWSSIYSFEIPIVGRYKLMAITIIFSNLFLLFFDILSKIASYKVLLLLSSLPLLTILYLLKTKESIKIDENVEYTVLPLPKSLIVVFGILSFVLYLNGGFMYKLILPKIAENNPFIGSLNFIVYMTVLFLIYRRGKPMKADIYLNLGISILGLSFVAFALVNCVSINCFSTAILIGTAFALLDLFFWTKLGDISHIYQRSFIFFGVGLSAQIASIMAGDVLVNILKNSGQEYRLIIAIYAGASIFLALSILPWFNKKLDQDCMKIFKEKAMQEKHLEEKKNIIINESIESENLTPRENEVFESILLGLSNQEIADKLYISPNTIKTHIRNIYRKIGVKNRRELLCLSINLNKKHQE